MTLRSSYGVLKVFLYMTSTDKTHNTVRQQKMRRAQAWDALLFTTEAPGPCQPGCDPGETEMITKGPPSTETFEAQVPILCGNWETACLSRQPCQSHQPALLAPLCIRLPVRAHGLQRPYKDLERRHRPDTASPPSPLRWPDAACVVTASVRVAGPRAH